MPGATFPSPRRPSPAVHGWGGALLLALAGHGLLLQVLLDDGWRSATPSSAAARPRWVDLSATPVVAAAKPVLQPDAAPEPPSSTRQRASSLQARAADVQRVATAPMVTAAGKESRPPATGAQVLASGPVEAPASDQEEAAEAAEAPPSLPPLPRYATRLPQPFEMQFALRRGRLQGSGELRFLRDEGGQYELSLHLQAQGRSMWQQNSTGVMADSGLQPERFTDRRRGRQLGTAQFDRQSAQVRFSGRAQPQPIAPVVQDRLSWLVQLPGVVAGDPALQRTGAQVWLQVVGARGGYQVWVFENLGPDAGTVPAAGASRALHFRRDPQRPYDTAIDIWLDPGLGFLPLQIHLTHVPSGDRIELERQP